MKKKIIAFSLIFTLLLSLFFFIPSKSVSADEEVLSPEEVDNLYYTDNGYQDGYDEGYENGSFDSTEEITFENTIELVDSSLVGSVFNRVTYLEFDGFYIYYDDLGVKHTVKSLDQCYFIKDLNNHYLDYIVLKSKDGYFYKTKLYTFVTDSTYYVGSWSYSDDRGVTDIKRLSSLGSYNKFLTGYVCKVKPNLVSIDNSYSNGYLDGYFNGSMDSYDTGYTDGLLSSRFNFTNITS